ncbi:MAG: site-specific integrase [Burkholderiales bacterium]|nr:site-specific integrase [Burkholderiales bacterium]
MDKIITIPSGIEVGKSNKSLRIMFMYNKVRCRETLKLPLTKANIKYCANLRTEILSKIARNEFNYAEYFPESKFAKKAGLIKVNKKIRCEQLFKHQLQHYEKLVENGYMSPSTLAGYRKIIVRRLIPELGSHFIQNLTAATIRKWVAKFENVTATTINNCLIPLRHVLEDALNDELIARNPLEGIAINKLIKATAKKSEFEINPFTEPEKDVILGNIKGQLKNLIQFGFWSGLRTSELIALKWADVDLERRVANIHQAKVHNVEKGTKTKSGVRTLILFSQALEALKNQHSYTGDCTYVFHNPNTNKPWANSVKVSDAWRKILLTLNIPYRNCYQMRHTYASTLLSNGENIFWVANQMGHKDIDMLIKHYGRWLPHETENGYKFAGKY